MCPRPLTYGLGVWVSSDFDDYVHAMNMLHISIELDLTLTASLPAGSEFYLMTMLPPIDEPVYGCLVTPSCM